MVNVLVVAPILLALYLWFLIFGCYTQGYLRHHYKAIWPVVSDSGNYIPEAASFSWTIVVIGSLFLVVATTRYLQLKAIISHTTFDRLIFSYYGPNSDPTYYRSRFTCLNWITYLFGITMGYSSMAVGCFRFAESFLFHNLMASGVFFVTPAYMVLNVYFSATFSGTVNTRGIFYARLVITLLAVASLVVFFFTEIIKFHLYRGPTINPVERLFWSAENPGYALHLVNSISEWIYLLLLGPYVYTFAEEFSRMTLQKMQCAFVFIDAEEEEAPAGTEA